MTADHTPDAKALFDAWLQLWNGDLSLAPEVASDDFYVHSDMIDGSDSRAVRGAEGLAEFVRAGRSHTPDLKFAVEVPPLFDGDYLSVRWTATGTYDGSFPGAEAPAGTVVTFTGTDTLRIRDGRFVEYWLNADGLRMLRQLQVA
ncbi:ester cyclase [Streptomyces sp. AD681]|uniref:ester cyclase n=1 Tax=Streptomyces sp. AD681 TaxID=3019069 RepID=UPI0022F170D2|nr:ester cyclase [Streptomyces sp. AD681]MDA5140663.1 ester cyclase [Streptomyces sp. AD681]